MSAFYDQKKVVVTGGAGFIGSHLCERLLSLGATVIAIDNFLTGSQQNISSFQSHPRFQFIQADLNQPLTSFWPDALQPDLILHFASPASPPIYQAHPVETYMVNAFATHALLDFIHTQSPHTRFLFASTSEAYGDPAIHPQPESYWGNVNPNGVRSCYDESKRMGETVCGVHARDFQLDVRIVRIFNTYGPRMNPDDGRIIPQFVSESISGQPITLYGEGTQTRSFCFVDDLVTGILLAAEKPEANGKTINLGNPDEYTALRTAEIIYQKVTGAALAPDKIAHLPLPKDDPSRRKPDITLAKALLGWQPTTSFEDGLAQTIAYFKTL